MSFLKSQSGSWRMAQRLRVITVLPEDLGLVPSTHSYSPVTLGDPIPCSNLRGQNTHAVHYIHSDQRHTREGGVRKRRRNMKRCLIQRKGKEKKTEKDTTSCLLNGYNFKNYSNTHWQSCRKIKH